jgi:hypothetical protein
VIGVWIVFTALEGGKIGFPFTIFDAEADATEFSKKIAAYSTIPVRVVHANIGEPVTGV